MRSLVFSLLFIGFVSKAQLIFVQELHEDTPSTQHYFGDALDSDGGFVAVSCVHGVNPKSWSGGYIQLYKNENNKLAPLAKLYPNISSGQDRMGQNAIAIHGNKVIVGDWMNTNQKYGAAHVFEFNEDGSWKFLYTLSVNDSEGIKSFGESVAIYNDIAVVGATSSVYIYQLHDESFKLIEMLSGEDDSGFGNNIALHEDLLIISSEWGDDKELKNTGWVDVFKRQSNGRYSKVDRLHGSKYDQAELEYGSSLDFDGEHLVIGAPDRDMGTLGAAGSIDVYKLEGDKFKFISEVYAHDMKRNKHRFGEKVVVEEGVIAVGEAQSVDHHGSIYTYEIEDEEINFIGKLESDKDTYYGNDLGQNGIAVSRELVIGGVPGDSYCDTDKDWGRGGCGSVLVYKMSLNKGLDNISSNNPIEKVTDPELLKIIKKEKLENARNDHINGDGLFIAQNRDDQKWGMFQYYKQIIPMEFDSIEFYGWNDPVTRVMKEGLWGAYPFDNVDAKGVSCEYDEIRLYTFEGQMCVAGKKEGLWRWVNWYTGIEYTGLKVKYHQELYIPRGWSPGF